MEENQQELIELLRRQENLLSELYAAFADKFSDFRKFWLSVSREEAKHAEWLGKLAAADAKGLVHFNKEHLNITAVRTFVSYIEGLLAKVSSTEFTVAKSFITAIDLEKALIEKNTFSKFAAVSPAALKVLESLKAETTKHIQKIEKMKQQAT